MSLFLLVRSLTWSSLFIGFVLVFLPARLLAPTGLRPASVSQVQWAGLLLTVAGGALAFWCIATFLLVGRGTPAPFDPPRRLVARGPYRFVRNPMYLGAALALVGAAVVYASAPLLAYAASFLLACHGFVVLYEEPALRESFGADYLAYTRQVQRWWPRAR